MWPNQEREGSVFRRILPLPSPYWRELSDMWVCHKEEYALGFSDDVIFAAPSNSLISSTAFQFHQSDLFGFSLICHIWLSEMHLCRCHSPQYRQSHHCTLQIMWIISWKCIVAGKRWYDGVELLNLPRSCELPKWRRWLPSLWLSIHSFWKRYLGDFKGETFISFVWKQKKSFFRRADVATLTPLSDSRAEFLSHCCIGDGKIAFQNSNSESKPSSLLQRNTPISFWTFWSLTLHKPLVHFPPWLFVSLFHPFPLSLSFDFLRSFFPSDQIILWN